MEGPTPVSALLHAATMVTAGVFLILRCVTIIELANFPISPLIVLGSATALYAGICAFAQYDMKKIIAYSTCSQLGYMFFTLGLDYPQLAMAHLTNHAFFKALLFLSAGAIIHFMHDEQDIRRVNKLSNILPFVRICVIIGSLAIMGFPFLTGFYSKDLILEFAYSRYIIGSHFTYYLGLIAAILTAAYSTRLIYNVFACRRKLQ